MTKRLLPDPPAHLSKRSKALWRQLVGTRVRSPGRLEMFRQALEQLDRCDSISEALVGADLLERGGRLAHAHPLLKCEKDARQLFARLWHQLGLHWDAVQDGGRWEHDTAAEDY